MGAARRRGVHAGRALAPARAVGEQPWCSMSSLTDADRARLTSKAFMGPLESIGWQDLQHDDPAVNQLREHLIANAGIPEMELVDPAVPGYAARAAFLLERDG